MNKIIVIHPRTPADKARVADEACKDHGAYGWSSQNTTETGVYGYTIILKGCTKP